MTGADLNSRKTQLKWESIEKRGSMICAYCYLDKPLKAFKPYKNRVNKNYTSYSSSCYECDKTRHKKCDKKPLTRLDQRITVTLNSARQRCLRSGKQFDLTKEFILDLFEKQQGKCFYTGIDLLIVPDESNYHCLSIDRLDSNKSYIKDNVVLCCWIINRIKSNLSVKDFIQYCSLIHNNKSNICQLK